MPTPVAFFSLPPSSTTNNSNSTTRKSAHAIITNTSASTTSPAFSDADTFAGSDLSTSPAPSSIQFSPPWSAHPLSSTLHNHHLATSVGPTDFTTMASSSSPQPSSSTSQHQYQYQQQLQYLQQQQQQQAQYSQQQQHGASPSHTDADAFPSTAAMPAKASPPLFSHSSFTSPSSPPVPNQGWDAGASARVISEDNNGIALPTPPHPPMNATTTSATSPIDDYTQFIDFEWDTSGVGSAWNGLDNGVASGGGGVGGMDGFFGLSPQYQYQYQYGMNIGAGAGGTMGMGMDELHDDGSTTWKQNPVPSSSAAVNENNTARATASATTTNNDSTTSKRTSLADIFANYSPPLPLISASSPPTLASFPAPALTSHPSSPSLPSPSSPHAHDRASTTATDMGSASAPNYGHGQQQQQLQSYENENFSFGGAATGLMMVPMPLVGGIGSSMPIPSWFASSATDGAHVSLTSHLFTISPAMCYRAAIGVLIY